MMATQQLVEEFEDSSEDIRQSKSPVTLGVKEKLLRGPPTPKSNTTLVLGVILLASGAWFLMNICGNNFASFTSTIPTWAIVSGGVIALTGLIGIFNSENTRYCMNVFYVTMCLVSAIQGIAMIISATAIPIDDDPLLMTGVFIVVFGFAAAGRTFYSVWYQLQNS